MCVSRSIGVIFFLRRFAISRSAIAGFLVFRAYTAYLIHLFVIARLAVAVCFGPSAIIRKLPFTKNVL